MHTAWLAWVVFIAAVWVLFRDRRGRVGWSGLLLLVVAITMMMEI